MQSKQYIVESIPISRVSVGQRRREKVGPLASMKASLERVGQIHPITVRMTDAGFELVAGERRLKAAEALGWTRIRARIGNFDDDTLRAIELEENTIRLDLSDFEASAAKLRQIEAAEREAETCPEYGQVSPKGKRGPARTPGSVRDVAARTALKKTEVNEVRRHVAAATEHPAFQGAQWKRSQVLAASEALESLPKRDQKVAVEMVSEPGVDPKSAVKMLETLAEKPAAERKEIVDLYKSDDPTKKSLAKTRAVQLPPVPPPVLHDLDEAVRWLDKAASRSTPRADRYESLAAKARELREAEEKDYERLKAAEGW